jgi:hypothetical protein
MAYFAIIENNEVTNVIIAETKEIAETVTGKTCVEYTDSNPASIGWTYDGTKFIAPVVETPIISEVASTPAK